ncbi:glutaredoxin domain-containing protein [Mycobacteroides chelonae]|uniref:glutaredoxin domain-containing protein n=1 Tax=Mycobacteroides chelonae TaxID=1774 RepID=UPI0022773CB0|nr:glutaredoxin domain-containing protein [Mycobacteroides chelonae]
MVTVYSPVSECYKCNLTKKRLEKEGVPFSEVVVDDELAAVLRGEGFSSFPVVKVDLGDGATWSWCDFRFDDIQRLKVLFKEAA